MAEKAVEQKETKDIRNIPHKNEILSMGIFGKDYYSKNRTKMKQIYFHPKTLNPISFRPATTSESISALVWCFENLTKPVEHSFWGPWDFKNLNKNEIFDIGGVGAGYAIRTSEGIYVNPPENNGDPIIDESYLKKLLNKTKPIRIGNGMIYIVPNTDNLKDFGFAEYSTCYSDNWAEDQDAETFADNGLARILEHTEGTALKLRSIARCYHHLRGVYLFGWHWGDEPVESFVYLGSTGCWDGQLRVRADLGDTGKNLGDYFSFGVLK
ncbi:MAG: hypothetical protein PHD81_01550 [Candidatus Nanoarchaeia archaeon]|nr:hypothetical protein [Candidatus Nanoarchaeia archaeon]MDD5587773.1 hypothetical protein [Candidatus Nanoarchaeia archaeon]